MGAAPFVKLVYGVLESPALREARRITQRTTFRACVKGHASHGPFCAQCGGTTELREGPPKSVLRHPGLVYGNLTVTLGGYASEEDPVVIGFVQAHVNTNEDFGVFAVELPSLEDLTHQLKEAWAALKMDLPLDLSQAGWHIVCGAN